MSTENKAASPRPQNTFDIGKVKKNFPQQLQERGKFCYWTYRQRDDRWTKLPHQYSGKGASSTDPDQWMSFADAVTMRKKRTGDGIGILLYGDGLAGIDIDDCASRDESGRIQLDGLAEPVVLAMDTYTELSPSGSGVHLLFYVDEDFSFDHSRWMINNKKISVEGKTEPGKMECYSSLWSARYFTVTGEKLDLRDYGGTSSGELRNCTDVLPDILDEFMAVEASGDEPHADQTAIGETSQEAAPPVTDTEREAATPQQTASPAAPVQYAASSSSRRQELTDSEIIDKMLATSPGAKALWHGDISKYCGDDSRADLALCCDLAFWCQYDPVRMDRVFRRSALMRDKWLRDDYRERTIAKAISMCKKQYDPNYRSGRRRSSGPNIEFGWSDTIGSPGDRDPDGQEAAPAAEASSSVSASDGGSTGQTQERSADADPEYQVFPDDPTGEAPYLDSSGKWYMPLSWSKQQKLDFASWLTDHPDAIKEPYQYDGQIRWPRGWTEDDQSTWYDEHNLMNPRYRPSAVPAVFQEHSSSSSEAAASSSGSESSSSGFCVFDPLDDDQEEELPEFPLDALPPEAIAVAKALSRSADAPDDISGNLVLAAISAAANGNYLLNVPKKITDENGIEIGPEDDLARGDHYIFTDWNESTNLYMAIEAEPGERKSTELRFLTKHMEGRENQWNEETDTERRDGERDRRRWTERKKSMEKKAANADDEEDRKRYNKEADRADAELAKIHIPPSGMLYTDDISMEELGIVCKEHNSRMAEVTDEGQFVKTMAGGYSKDDANIDIVKKGYGADSYRLGRISRENFNLHPSLVILLLIQPIIADSMIGNDKFTGEGVNPRFCFVDARSHSHIGSRKVEESVSVPDEVADAFWKKLDPLFREVLDPPEEIEMVKMSQDAYEIFKDFHNNYKEVLLRKYRKAKASKMAQWCERLTDKALHAALCIHVFNQGGRKEFGFGELTAEEMQSGVTIAKYWYAHARSVYGQTSHQLPEDQQEALLLWSYIKESGKNQLTMRELHRLVHARFKHRSEMDDGLNVLTDRGYIRMERIRTGTGRPTETVTINPEAMEYEKEKEERKKEDRDPDLT